MPAAGGPHPSGVRVAALRPAYAVSDYREATARASAKAGARFGGYMMLSMLSWHCGDPDI